MTIYKQIERLQRQAIHSPMAAMSRLMELHKVNHGKIVTDLIALVMINTLMREMRRKGMAI